MNLGVSVINNEEILLVGGDNVRDLGVRKEILIFRT